MHESTTDLNQLLTHAAFVQRLANRLAGADGGDDLAQATLTASIESPPAGQQNVRGWLAVVANNLWRNERRARTRRRRHEGRLEAPDASPSVADIAAREEVRRRVVAAVLELPESLRQVVLLHYYEGLDSPAIGRRLELAASSVRTRLQQATERLRRRLDAEHGGSRAAWVALLAAWDRPSATVAVIGSPVRVLLAVVVAVVAVLTIAVSTWPERGLLPVASSGQARAAAGSGIGASTVLAPDRQPVAAPMVRVAALAERDSGYVWQPPLGTLHGAVVRNDGTPAEAVTVLARTAQRDSSPFAPLPPQPILERQATTAADGTFLVADLPVGCYDVDVIGPEGLRAWQRVAIGELPVRVEFQLDLQHAKGAVRVRVVDLEGLGVAGAEVMLAVASTRSGYFGWDRRPPLRGKSDEHGWFTITDRPELEPIGKASVCARTADGRCGMTSVRGGNGAAPVAATVVVAPAATIVGRLTGLASWDGVRVLAHAKQMLPLGAECFEQLGAVAGDGSFRIESLPAGDYKLQVAGLARRADNEQFWNTVVTVVAAGSTTSSVPAIIDCLPGARVRGTVQDDQGRVVVGAEVTAVRPWFNNITRYVLHHEERAAARWFARERTTTDARGCYELSLSPGTWQVVVTAAGLTMDVRRELAIGVDPVVELSHLLSRDGALAGNTTRTVGLRRADRPDIVHQISGSQSFAVRGLAPGTWQLGEFDDDGAFMLRTTVAIVAGTTQWMDLTRGNEVLHRGILLHHGQPLADHEVRIGMGVPVVTAADGSFELRHVHNDDAPDLFVHYRGLTVFETQQLDGVIELPGRIVEIRTVAADGTALPAMIDVGDTYAGNQEKYEVHNGLGRSHVPNGILRILLVDRHEQTTIVAQFEDGSRSRCVLDEQDLVELVRPATGTIAVRVVDRDGRPCAGQRIEALAWGRDVLAPFDPLAFADGCADQDEVVIAVTDLQGEALLRGVLTGQALLQVTGTGGAGAGAQTVAVERDSSVSCTFVLTR